MGLSFSHGDACWSYSGFMHFRKKLAMDAMGIELNKMVGFGPKANRSWEHIKNPLVTLLNHSDCDGWILPRDCKAIEPLLREAVSHWPDNHYDKKMALRLADGMKKAAKTKRGLEFR